MKTIGKANKYYTLWDVWEEDVNPEVGRPYTIIHHQYLKNLSIDYDKAIAKAGDAQIDLSLHGHTSWQSIKHAPLPDDEFNFGKYTGQKISDCTDYDYLYWVVESCASVCTYEGRLTAEDILTKQGYKRINEYKLATPEEVKDIENSFAECDKLQEKLDNDGEITVTIERNIDPVEGNIRIGLMDIIFPNFKVLNYAGYIYGLPINANGKAKKIKGKEITIIPESYEIKISEYGWGATMEIKVKDFIVK